MSDILNKILDVKAEEIRIAQKQRDFAGLRRDVESDSELRAQLRNFEDSLRGKIANGQAGVIAEVKKASPSKGVIRADFDPPALARAYLAGGATCLSVLTDVPYFQGDDAYLAAARAEVPLPVLRKDFMIDPWQVAESRAIGADCILLIMAALEDAQAAELEAAAMALGMDVLAEVHNAEELERATRLTTRMVGINNRDLKSLKVDLATSVELAAMLPQGYLLVGESGIRTRADLDRLAAVGITTYLVGESLMAQDDVTAATRALLEG